MSVYILCFVVVFLQCLPVIGFMAIVNRFNKLTEQNCHCCYLRCATMINYDMLIATNIMPSSNVGMKNNLSGCSVQNDMASTAPQTE
jgi:hypothetical protein